MTIAGWYDDPTGRSQVRYFDGTAWTDNVATNGRAILDPITVPTTAAGALSGPVAVADPTTTVPPAAPAKRRWTRKRIGILAGAGIVAIAAIAAANTPTPVPTTNPASTLAVTTITLTTTSVTTSATSATTSAPTTTPPPTAPPPTTLPPPAVTQATTIAPAVPTPDAAPPTVGPADATSAAVAPQPVVSTPKTTALSTYYANCAAARTAGATPLHRGDPGYRSGLDRDGDGVACE